MSAEDPEKVIADIIAALEALPCSDRLMIMRQNPGDYHNWSKKVGPIVYPFTLAAYLKVGLEAVASARALLAKGADQ